MRLPNEEPPEWRARTQQCGGEGTAFEVTPRIEHILRAHAGAASRRLGDLVPGRFVRGNEAVSVMHHAVAREERELVLEPGFLSLQTLVDPHRVRRFESRPHHRARRLVLVFKPANLQPKTFAD